MGSIEQEKLHHMHPKKPSKSMHIVFKSNHQDEEKSFSVAFFHGNNETRQSMNNFFR